MSEGKEPEGPIAKFLRTTGTSREKFELKLKAGDLAATLLFVGDVFYGKLIHEEGRRSNRSGLLRDPPGT